MTIETKVGDVLASVCPRVFADFASTATPRPYVTFQRIGGNAVQTVSDEMPNLVNATFQIDVWSSSRGEADALARQIEAALRTALSLQARPVGESIATSDPGLDLRGTSQDFTVWATR